MGSCGFRSVVSEVVLGCLDDTGDGGDVDDCARIAFCMLGRFLEEREKGCGHEEDLRNIRSVGISPGLEGFVLVIEEISGHFLCGRGFGLLRVEFDAGVIDKDVEMALLLGNLLGKVLDGGLLRDVTGDWDDLAWDVFAVHLADFLELVGCSSTDVDLGSIGSCAFVRGDMTSQSSLKQLTKCLCSHQPNTCTSTCDEGNFAFDSVQVLELELLHTLIERHGWR